MPNPRFTRDQVDQAIQHVIDHGAVDRAQTVRYTVVFQAAGLDPPQDLYADGEGDLVTIFMKSFHDRCIEQGFPPLDSLVVHVTGKREGLPGSGYFKVNHQADPFSERGDADSITAAYDFWMRQKAEVRSWGDDYRKRHS